MYVILGRKALWKRDQGYDVMGTHLVMFNIMTPRANEMKNAMNYADKFLMGDSVLDESEALYMTGCWTSCYSSLRQLHHP